MFIHDFAPLKLPVEEMNNRVFQFGYICQKLILRNLNIISYYLSVLTDGSFLLLFLMLANKFFIALDSLFPHFAHDFPGFFIIKFIELVMLLNLCCLPGLFLSLLFLLWNYLITHYFLQYLQISLMIQCYWECLPLFNLTCFWTFLNIYNYLVYNVSIWILYSIRIYSLR